MEWDYVLGARCCCCCWCPKTMNVCCLLSLRRHSFFGSATPPCSHHMQWWQPLANTYCRKFVTQTVSYISHYMRLFIETIASLLLCRGWGGVGDGNITLRLVHIIVCAHVRRRHESALAAAVRRRSLQYNRCTEITWRTCHRSRNRKQGLSTTFRHRNPHIIHVYMAHMRYSGNAINYYPAAEVSKDFLLEIGITFSGIDILILN